ncbi:MAG TPA: universal stress protein [Blastocatellia bacterium]|nr:universal stress protein [Blastocatellia bacterium]
MKVLIAYDGSEYADKAINDLQRAGLPRGAEAMILSAADVFVPPISPEEYEQAETAIDKKVLARAREMRKKADDAVEQARKMALEASRKLQDGFPDWTLHAEAVGDSPAWAIIKKADEWDADLILVGTHGRSAPGRFLLGSVSQKVADKARCSVRIGRGRAREQDAPLRVLLGVDGSPGSEAALDTVAGREWPAGAQARLITVLDLMISTSLRWVESGDESEETWIRKMIDAATEKLRRKGLEVSSVIRDGEANRVLIREAEEWGADSIFVGARGLRRIERLFLGSVSSAVAARASCSVEIVRAKQADR